MSPVRAVVIGLGAMGRHHVRVLRELDGVDLVAVVDQDPKTLELVSRRAGVTGYSSVEEALERSRPQLAVVAVPTAQHSTVGQLVLQNRVALLLEKPIAATVEEAQALIATADRAGVPFSIGHIERFNPAVLELRRRLEQGELGHFFLIHARRLGPFPPRIADVGVVTDLATHDIDVFNLLCGSEPIRVTAELGRRINSANEDFASALLAYPDSRTCVFEVNWLTPTKIRELFVTGELGMFCVNYLTQDIYLYRNNYRPTEWDAMSRVAGVSEGDMTRIAISRIEPLRAELQSFVNAVRLGEPPMVSGREALAALRVAKRVLEAGTTHQVS